MKKGDWVGCWDNSGNKKGETESRLQKSKTRNAYALAVLAWFNFFIKRDLRRAALFFLMMPLPAALSSAWMACFTSCSDSVEWLASALFASLTSVRVATRIERLRTRRRALWRIAFSAACLLANFKILRVFIEPHITSDSGF